MSWGACWLLWSAGAVLCVDSDEVVMNQNKEVVQSVFSSASWSDGPSGLFCTKLNNENCELRNQSCLSLAGGNVRQWKTAITTLDLSTTALCQKLKAC